MMAVEELAKIVQDIFPEGKVRVIDLTGTQDHFKVEVASESFRGKILIDQHREVQDPLNPLINDGRIHALSIKTCLPENWQDGEGLVNLE